MRSTINWPGDDEEEEEQEQEEEREEEAETDVAAEDPQDTANAYEEQDGGCFFGDVKADYHV